MNTRNIILIVLTIITVSNLSYANVDSKEIPYTFEDRARLIKVEERLNSLEKNINIKFEAMDEKFEAMNNKFDGKFASMEKKIDDKFNSMEILIYFVLGSIMSLVGFILWDRRSSLKPIENKSKEIEHTNEKLLSAIREYAKNQPELLEILRINGLL